MMISKQKQVRRKRFDFDKTKALATSGDPAIRKETFIGYFKEFGEFPSYFFDNEMTIDKRLFDTMQHLLVDAETTKEMRTGVEDLLRRLPS